jgi:hypothetical protein
MITTLSAMQMSRLKTRIIGLLGLLFLCGLTGCSSLRLAYATAPTFSWMWLDGYVDFSRKQTPLVRKDIDAFFGWHRTTQLPAFLPLLAAAQAQVMEPTTPAQSCEWEMTVRDRLQPTLDKALGMAADWLPGLGEAQFRNLEKRYAKNIQDMREEYLQPDPAARQTESFKRALERAERLYGTLEEPQRKVIRDAVAASPFDPELWMNERQRRQRDTLQTVRRLQAEHAEREQRIAALEALVARTERSPDPNYRAYQQRLTEYNCGFAAQIHNATTPAQRRKARENLQVWQEDLRVLMGGG